MTNNFSYRVPSALRSSTDLRLMEILALEPYKNVKISKRALNNTIRLVNLYNKFARKWGYEELVFDREKYVTSGFSYKKLCDETSIRQMYKKHYQNEILRHIFKLILWQEFKIIKRHF